MNGPGNWFSAAALAALALFSPGTLFAQYTISTIATSTSGSNYCVDGTGVAADAAGNVYLTGTYPNSLNPPCPGGFTAIFEMRAGTSPFGAVGQWRTKQSLSGMRRSRDRDRNDDFGGRGSGAALEIFTSLKAGTSRYLVSAEDVSAAYSTTSILGRLVL